jgi:hypothetical protein
VAQTSQNGGVIELRRTFFDARGNAVAVERAFPPQLVWEQVLARSYGCFNSK